jgi:hypothetical protein
VRDAKLAGSAAAFYSAAHLSSANIATLRARQLLDLKAITDANGCVVAKRNIEAHEVKLTIHVLIGKKNF